MVLAFLRGSCEREKEPTPWKAPNTQGDQLRWRDLKVAKKRAAAGLRTAEQSESCTDLLTTFPQHSLRCLGRGWVLRLSLQRSVPGRGLWLAVWERPKGLRSHVAWAR